MPKGAVYLIRTQIAPDREAEWDRWHREVHVPEVLQEKGFRRARRLRLVEGEESHRYWTLYDVESVAALQAFRQGPASVRLRDAHDQRFGRSSDLKRATFEVLDELRPPPAPSEAAVVRENLHVLLRPATAADEPSVLRLLSLMFDLSPPPGYSEAGARAAFQQYLANPENGLFVAEVAGKVVGFAAATTYPTLRFGRRGHLEELVVEPTVRSKGVAHRLLEYAERWMAREGASHLSTAIGLHREESRRFLTHEGFSDASLVLRKRGPGGPLAGA